VDFFEQALVYDSRDSETVTRHGQWHQLVVRESPGGTEAFPYRYAQIEAQLHEYWSPLPQRLTIAARLVGDWQMGDPPFYELARFDDTFALGGSKGVRGVPGQRYYGKTKVFGNFQATVFVAEPRAFGKSWSVGIAGFVDGGRVWTEGFDHPELDGTSLGLKYGVGGGVRLREDQSLVIRLDAAWSPDARPVGVYFGAGEIF
jgi:outer membrane protein assembly factor BamA